MPERDPADPHILKSNEEERLQTITFAVDGMTCESCVEKVEEALMKRDGVKEVKVDLQAATVTVTFDSRHLDAAAIHEAILATGYQPAGLVS